MFGAVLDTCVLWPSLQRDFLLSLAVENLYRPLWNDAILAELELHEERKLIRRGTDPATAHRRAAGLVAVMTNAFDDALVRGWEPLEGSFGLPDPGDEHVVAAAVVGSAGALVTENFRDFPASLIPTGLQVVGAAEFAANTCAVDPARALAAIQKISLRRRDPAQTVDQLLDILATRYKMHEAVELMVAA
ncbi:PIN domain-containing protein [Nocardia amikacinitolerans]|uniref:PIN domain-containing protein n=1 Tax=Nocardia amikacinitolerans TaxID=756689 RepID=A0A285LRV3_9NOCA|nr:PIN domain-containing protein [Nocardia amikacinitolerans]SNY87658.1 PIN domain-containing protein [Nocardia amikacinitolerans]